jgi:hypothetical protein
MVSGSGPRLGLVAPKCVVLNIVWFSLDFGAWVLFVNLVFYNLVDVWTFLDGYFIEIMKGSFPLDSVEYCKM